MKILFNRKWVPILMIMGILSLVSCEDYLNKAPEADLSPVEAYESFKNFQGFTEELYNCIPVVVGCDYHSCWNYGEDEYWEPNETRLLSNQIDQGNYWAWNNVLYSWFKEAHGDADYTYGNNRFKKGRLWGLSWYGIRKANIGIANLDNLVNATQEEKDLIAGQLYFFRGWFHFMLMQYWGGLPYIDQVLPADGVFRFTRLNYHATADKATADFQKAADLLPVDWDQTTAGTATLGNNNQRINKVMALAYMGKNLLWAGSPLMNKESTGNDGYNIEYCKKAADAFAEALKICHSTNRYYLADSSQYSQLFYIYAGRKIPGLKEAIFLENLVELQGRFRWNQVNDFRPVTILPTGIKVNPTANYVDYYGMKNGLPITDPASGYNPEYPWKNRDPRFYHDIIFDAVQVCKNSTGSLPKNKEFASLQTGGLFRYIDGNKAVLTGYMNSKFTSKYLNDYDGYKENNVMALSFMRLADVYLMYAEATAVGYGSPQSTATNFYLSAKAATDSIRDRFAIGRFDDKFLGNTNDFLPELYRERAVELAFEGHRFTDLRRWMLLLQKPYTLKTAVEFDRDAAVSDNDRYADPTNARVLNLRQRILVERKLENKHYWFPLRASDITLYKELKQNPGW